VTLEYVQTWMVRKGMEVEHDRVFKEWVLKLAGNPYLRGIRFPSLEGIRERKRVVVYEFDDVSSWVGFLRSLGDDYLDFIDVWIGLIEVDSFSIFFQNY